MDCGMTAKVFFLLGFLLSGQLTALALVCAVGVALRGVLKSLTEVLESALEDDEPKTRKNGPNDDKYV